MVLTLALCYRCTDEQPTGSVIAFASAVGDYSGLCRVFDSDTQTYRDSIQTNMTVSATTLTTALFQSSCFPEGELILDYTSTSGDTIRFAGSNGEATYMASPSRLEVVAYAADQNNILYSGSR